MKISDIIQRDCGDFHRFSITDIKNNRFVLHMEMKRWNETWKESMQVETSVKRLEQLANEILNYLNKKVKLEEWEPTMNEFEQRLREVVNPNCAVELWFIDWVRTAVTLKRKNDVKQARQIYEWLHGNKEWLYRDEFGEEKCLKV